MSGVAGLVYEVCWIREASLVFGSTQHALSTVLAVFFLGLAVGSHLFGRVSLRAANPLRVYAALELGIALLALATLPLFRMAGQLYGLVYHGPSDSGLTLDLVRIGCITLVLLPPTLLMGGTLPLFVRRFVTDPRRVAGSVGRLYALNTLGAAVGAAVTGLVLIPSLGVRASVSIAAGLNVAAAAVAMWRTRDQAPATSALTASVPPAPAAAAAAPLSRTRIPVLAGYVFLTGFVALGNEVLWSRFLALLFPNTVYTYTFTLTVVLVGIVIGSVVAGAWFDRSKHHALWLGALQVALGLTVLVLLRLPPTAWQGMQVPLVAYALMLLPPAILSGAAFPLAARMWVSDVGTAGAGVGTLIAFNTVGGILGAVMLGFVGLPAWGLDASLRLTTLVSVAGGAIAWLLLDERRPWALRAGAAATAAAAWAFVPLALPTRLPADYLSNGGQLIDFREGTQSTLAVVKRAGTITLEMDHWWQGQDRKNQQLVAAHLPMLLHPAPRTALVVGVGAGQTPSRFTYYDLERLDCVDIEPAVFDVITRHFASEWMTDPRVRLLREDGRHWIAHANTRYDVISLEVGQVFRPGIASFYTRDFYQRVRADLEPGGLVSQFVSIGSFTPAMLRSVVATFIDVFPQSTLWFNSSELLLVGVNTDHFVVPPSTLERLADNRRVHDDLDYRHWGGDSLALRHPDVFLASYLLGPRELATLAAGAPLLHDDRPVLEYETSVTAGHLSDELDNVNAIRTGMGPLSEVMEVPATAAAHIDYLRSRNVGQLEAASWLRRLEGLGPAADHAEIADAVRRALAANPDNAKANRIAGDLASLDGHYAEALPFYALATADRPDDGVAHRGYANALMNAGRPLEAADHYRAALLDLGENADLRNDLGMCVGQSGDLAGAAREFRRALALDPNHAEARGNLQRVRLMIAARQSTPVARPAVPPPRHD